MRIKYHILNFSFLLRISLIETLLLSFPKFTIGLYYDDPYLEIPSMAFLSIGRCSSRFVELDPSTPVEVDLFLMEEVLRLRPGLLVRTHSFPWRSLRAESVCSPFFMSGCRCLDVDLLFYLEREILTFSLVIAFWVAIARWFRSLKSCWLDL